VEASKVRREPRIEPAKKNVKGRANFKPEESAT
jgi:hypothetical protein